MSSYREELKNADPREINSNLLEDTGPNIIDKKIFKKRFSSFTGSGITLTNNEIENIIKIMKYLENRGILLKGTTRKVASQEEQFPNFVRFIMTASLPLIYSHY